MARIKGILDKIPKKKLAMVKIGLRSLYQKEDLTGMHRNYLVTSLIKYKKLYEENLACDLSNDSLQAGNAWGVKDTKSVLNEKNTLIFQLEQQISELKRQLEKCMEEEPKHYKENIKMITVSFPDQVNYLYEKIKILNEQLSEGEFSHKEAVLELEARIVELQKQNVRVEESNKLSVECSNRNGFYDFMSTTESMQKIENENLHLKGIIKKLEQKQFFAEKEMKHSKQEMEQREKVMKLVEARFEEANKIYNSLSGDKYMIEEIKSVSDAYESIVKENGKLVEQIGYLNKKNRELEGRIADNYTKAKITEKNVEIAEKYLKETERIKNAIETERQARVEKHGTIEEELASKTNKLSEMNNSVRVYKRDLAIAEAATEDKIKNIYALMDTLKECREKSVKLDKENKRLEATVDAYEKSFKENTTVVDLNIQIQDLKEYVYCALCKSNLKTHVIDKCMHCFCEECLEHRLKTRSRNCPKCNHEYTRNDIKRVYL